MADEESNHHHIIHPPSPPPLGMRHQGALFKHGGCGEIVEVEGGHIVRATGKKDRHSKVCTAKGSRDRRVRLSAPTAIQFYDVQDRLCFDRPSSAVDWLIKNAQSAIDHLRQAAANKPKTLIPPPATALHGGPGEEIETPSRDNTQSQDLCLSLHSFQKDPPFADETEHALFESSAASWDQWQHNHRMVTWNNGGEADSNGGGGFVFASPATTTSFQTQSQFFSQRGPLQSINTPMLCAWFDDPHYHHYYHPYRVPQATHQTAIPSIALASSVSARYQSEHDKPSSASSD